MLARDDVRRILIVDDHAVVRQGVRSLLEDAIKRTEFGEAGDAREAMRLFQDDDWDLVILDLSLPGRGGLDVLKDMKGISPEVPVLILSMRSESQVGPRALKAGASGYVSKSSASEELATAVRRSLEGRRHISSHLAETLAMTLDDDHPDAPHESLSDREYEVMCLIGSGRTVGEIAEQLSLSPKTISTYRARVLDKMNMQTNAELMAYAVQRGLVTPEYDPDADATVSEP